LDAFNRRIVAAIREADPEMPILLDGWAYASPLGLAQLRPVAGDGILYAFHFYDPWDYTTFRVNNGRFAYPERLPGPGGAAMRWDKDTLRARVAAVAPWARQHAVPKTRIVAAEFRIDRRIWDAETRGEDPERYKRRHDNPLWQVLRRELRTPP